MDATMHTVTTTKRVITLPVPSNATELDKALRLAISQLTSTGKDYYDDSVTVTVTDESIELSFVESTKAS